MQLIVNTFGTSLRRQGDRFLIKPGGDGRPVAISAHKIHSLVPQITIDSPLEALFHYLLQFHKTCNHASSSPLPQIVAVLLFGNQKLDGWQRFGGEGRVRGRAA